jgi:hypothetical protein
LHEEALGGAQEKETLAVPEFKAILNSSIVGELQLSDPVHSPSNRSYR